MCTMQKRERGRITAALVAAFTLALAVPSALAAQQRETGRIDGVVTDSLHRRPAAGATVLMSRRSPEPQTYASALTDSEGRFHFDSLLAGRYTLSFFNPTLDSLELVPPDRELLLDAGAHQQVALAVPSAATLRGGACPGVALAATQGAVIGSVRDATTERPIAGATVVVVWHELSVNRATLGVVNEERRGSVRSDSAGAYRLCGVPWGEMLLVQAQDSAWSSGAVETLVDSVVTVRVLPLSIDRGVRPATIAATADTVGAGRQRASAGQTGTASIRGVVRGTGDLPVADVQLHVLGAASTARSDSLGRFVLAGLPAGSQQLEARRVGYAASRMPVELRSAQVLTQDMHMSRIVSLDSVLIIAQRSRYPEFERHRKNGWGRYLDASDIARRNPFQTSDLLRMMPGFRVEHAGSEDVVVGSRGHSSISNRSCSINVIIDRVQHLDLSMVHPSEIAGLEAYPSNAGMPSEFSMGSPCGAIVIWTKR